MLHCRADNEDVSGRYRSRRIPQTRRMRSVTRGKWCCAKRVFDDGQCRLFRLARAPRRRAIGDSPVVSASANYPLRERAGGIDERAGVIEMREQA